MSHLPNRRVHVNNPANWATEMGTDYWYFCNSATVVTGLTGWTMTALSLTASGLLADMHSSADIDPYSISFGAASDQLLSPIIWGGYEWQKAVAGILGYAPSQLCYEVFAKFPTNSANEPTTCFGFVKGVPLTAGNAVATIYTTGANWTLTDGTVTDAGAADDASWHLFKVVMDTANTEWFLDGASQGTITTETDEFPIGFGASCTTTNRIEINYIHVWAQ